MTTVSGFQLGDETFDDLAGYCRTLGERARGASLAMTRVAGRQRDAALRSPS